MKLLIASTNPGKLREIREIIAEAGLAIELVPQPDDFPEIEETGTSFEENALLKARTAFELYKIPVLADDSGLCIDALNGEPGIFSARYAGYPVNHSKNIEKVLISVKDKPQPWTAHFISTLAFVSEDTTFITEGLLHGRIINEQKGFNGFGYDPVFIPAGFTQTLAELSDAEKNSISHRKQALTAFCNKLKELKIN